MEFVLLKMESVVCFGHVRIDNVGPQQNKAEVKHRNMGLLPHEENFFIAM